MLELKSQRDTVIEKNLGLVHSICKKFSGRGIEYDDLYQAGCIGLIKAVDAFKEEMGYCFSTYAVPVIMGEVRRLFRDGGAVKISRSVKELSVKVVRVAQELEIILGREPTISEIANKIGVSVEEVTDAVCATQPIVSLTYKSDDGVTEADLPTLSTEDEISDRLVLDEAFKYLSETEKRIMEMRYYKGMTQSKTAEKFNMSQVQVSRIEKRCLKKLKDILNE